MSELMVFDKPKDIEAFRLLALKGMLKLEIRGIRFKGGSIAVAVRKAMGGGARKRLKLLAEYETWLRERGILVEETR